MCWKWLSVAGNWLNDRSLKHRLQVAGAGFNEVYNRATSLVIYTCFLLLCWGHLTKEIRSKILLYAMHYTRHWRYKMHSGSYRLVRKWAKDMIIIMYNSLMSARTKTLWQCLSLGLEWKLTFSSPVATAEFSKFAGIWSAALMQHHLLGFEIVQWEFHHLH